MHAVIVGAGTVGQATGLGLEKLGHTVTFIDTLQNVIDKLHAQGSDAYTPEKMSLDGCDAIFVTVNAPTTETGIDTTSLLAATRNIGAKLAETSLDEFPLIIFRSTQPPGTTRNTLIPTLHQTSGRQVNEHFGVAYWPEYLRAATAQQDFDQPRIITIATPQLGDPSHRYAARIAIGMNTNIHWLPLEAAELQKYCSNVANAVKISTFNWFRMLAHKLGIDNRDIDHIFDICVESSESLWNREYGLRNLGPYEGACLPKDIAALRIYAETAGLDTSLLKAVEAINREIANGG